MEETLIVGNWKSNKSEKETLEFFKQLKENLVEKTGVASIICPSYLSLSSAALYVRENSLNVFLGAQDVSAFEDGAYTGEVSARQISELATYVIIGHSERRTNFGENDEMLSKKVAEALKYNLTPIFCIQNENTFIPEGVKIAAYEPIEAIGTGIADTPEDAAAVAAKVYEKNKGVTHVLYGGSVKEDNVSDFLAKQEIKGVLIGGASLDPLTFASIISKC